MPRFAINWIRNTSATPFFASPRRPGEPVQDGAKGYLFCGDCEQVLSKDERSFRELAFSPRHTDASWDGFTYGEWLPRFVAGLALRAAVAQGDDTPRPEGAGTRALRQRALPDWRAFLLGRSSGWGDSEFHVVLTDYEPPIYGPGVEASIGTYLMRAVDMTYAASPDGRRAYLYAMIPGFVFLIPLVPTRLRDQHGTKVHARGRISKGSQRLEDFSLWEFVNSRAAGARGRSRGTERQEQARVQRLQSRLDNLPGSETETALNHMTRRREQGY